MFWYPHGEGAAPVPVDHVEQRPEVLLLGALAAVHLAPARLAHLLDHLLELHEVYHLVSAAVDPVEDPLDVLLGQVVSDALEEEDNLPQGQGVALVRVYGIEYLFQFLKHVNVEIVNKVDHIIFIC